MTDWKPPKFGYPVWMGIPATDVDRAHKFYADVFDLPFKGATESSEHPQTELRQFDFNPDINLSGGIMRAPDSVGVVQPGAGGICMNWFVEDVEKTSKVIEAAGGKILSGTEKEGQFGLYRYFEDTEGNIGAVYQMAPPAK